MKLSATCFVFLVVYFTCSAQSFTKNDLKKLQWIIGNWKMPVNNGFLYEQWRTLNDSTLQSKGFVVKTGADTLIFETVQIKFSKGKLCYIPTITGQNNNEPVIFGFQSATAASFTAVNVSHDFPQKIYYSATGKNALYAEVSGNEKGKSRKEVFHFTKD